MTPSCLLPTHLPLCLSLLVTSSASVGNSSSSLFPFTLLHFIYFIFTLDTSSHPASSHLSPNPFNLSTPDIQSPYSHPQRISRKHNQPRYELLIFRVNAIFYLLTEVTADIRHGGGLVSSESRQVSRRTTAMTSSQS